jgi:DNA (cytosine-5)-methyltransferase 1
MEQARIHQLVAEQGTLALNAIESNQDSKKYTQVSGTGLKTVFMSKVGTNRGHRRIWIQGERLRQIGFQPGQAYRIEKNGTHFVLHLDTNGNRTVTSAKKKELTFPIIDLNNKEVDEAYAGMETVRIIMRMGEVHILPLASDIRVQERMLRAKEIFANNLPVPVGSLSHGGGVMSLAFHEGLEIAGLKSELVFANDIRDEMLDQACNHNPAWTVNTQYISAPMQEIAFDPWIMQRLLKCLILEAGIPCSGASVAGRAKRGLGQPEDHPEVGHLVVAFLAIIAKVNPLVINLENVVPYQTSASMSIIRNQLSEWGYILHEVVIAGNDFNVLENRKRMVMVAVTKGIEFDFGKLQYPEKKTLLLSDILEDLPLDDPSWSKMEGLKAKEISDKAAGKSFAMQIFDGSEDHIGTLTKGIQKNRSTDPKIQHPTNPDLLRIPTLRENAAAKGIPEVVIEGMSKTLGGELLGQSIVYPKFVEVSRLIGQTLIETFAPDKMHVHVACRTIQ